MRCIDPARLVLACTTECAGQDGAAVNELYYRSVGRGASLLRNAPPERRGSLLRARQRTIFPVVTSTPSTIKPDPSGMKQPSTVEPAGAPWPTMGSVDTATLALLAAWKAEDATTDPEKLREADEQIAEFKNAMNENRAATGARPLFS
jgi:hypothetical protein